MNYDRSTDEGFIPAKSSEPIFGSELLTYCEKRREDAKNKYIDNRARYIKDSFDIEMWDLRIEALKNPKLSMGDVAYLYKDGVKQDIPVLSNQVGAFFIAKDFLEEDGKGYLCQWVRLDNDPQCEKEEIYVKVDGTSDNPRIAYYDEDLKRWINEKPEDLDYHLEIEPIEEFAERVKAYGFDLRVERKELFRWYKVSKRGKQYVIMPYGIPCNYAEVIDV